MYDFAAIHHAVGDAGAVLGAIAALVGLNAAAKGLYRRTLGRRRDRYTRLGRLGTGAQIGFFEAVLGEPPAMRRTVVKDDFRIVLSQGDPGYNENSEEAQDAYVEMSFTEAIFIDRDYYVQAICNEDDTVLAFSVTVRRSNFHPVFQLPPKVSWRARRRWRQQTGEAFKPLFRIRLGRTRFGELDTDDPAEFRCPHFRAAIGARSFFYSEDHYYGNPGYYQTFVFTASSTAPVPAGMVHLAEAIREAGGEEWPDPCRLDQPEWDQMPGAQSFRRQAAITTYTVLRVDLWLENYPSSFGPHGDEVRTLP